MEQELETAVEDLGTLAAAQPKGTIKDLGLASRRELSHPSVNSRGA